MTKDEQLASRWFEQGIETFLKDKHAATFNTPDYYYASGYLRAKQEARIEELTKSTRWQPIEKAPKDGTHILLANKSGVSEGGWLSDIDYGAEWEGQIGMAGFWRADGTDWPNTHWMPLPKPPSD
ncbi:DUF551 domain-containing protein [Polynucleobacter sp.]|uniref:DUF551 domain-containing protein n=1 Tax=Polynucleobacter sp. TaxID=2029855 RepID=UPI003F6980CC